MPTIPCHLTAGHKSDVAGLVQQGLCTKFYPELYGDPLQSGALRRPAARPGGPPYDAHVPHPVRADRSLTNPHPSRLSPDHPLREEILDRHEAALAAGKPGYLDPGSGLFVLTAAYLLAQGRCCQSGCRHCPYLR
jgi:hypothetical protein